jgi:hypothetical protein
VSSRAFVARLWLASILVVAGCATQTPPGSTSVSRSAAPAARYNLAGYSEGFKQGYGDACASRRNAERYKADTDYQMGWNDGNSLCRK